MIKANDLRAGNIVASKTHNILKTAIEGFTPQGIVFLRGVSTYDMLSNLEPIPLTPEILEKCRAITRAVDISFEPDNDETFVIEADQNTVGEYYYSAGEGCRFSRNIKYLHELQNLYFAIVGEELKVEL